ncbi:DUF4007 family protein [Bacillus sp. FJAT-27445]|uniref:DUF4007 family protein n=1 Tax=Bacillus sp. FJAT-27445 TaxID=1679166 RepID=UPI0007445355|nr:DUF4007 family protein [Bacillus sp. FJAT-27445]
MAYARHESFYLRDKWVSKGLKVINEDPRFFYDKDGFEKIGLGKNMVKSLRFWLSAMNLIEETKSKEHQMSELGELIFSVDRLLQRNETVALIHYNLIRNKNDLATVFYWFFNIYKETITQRPELKKSFKTWVKNNEPKPVSETSLNRDIDVLIQQYTKNANENDPEDFIFSPFTKLNLIKEEPSEEKNENIRKVSPEVNEIGISALYYVLLNYSLEKGLDLISLEEIINEPFLWGKVFNLSRNKIIEALNILTNHEKFPIEYLRTNNLDNVRVPKIHPIELLNYEFKAETGRATIKHGV